MRRPLRYLALLPLALLLNATAAAPAAAQEVLSFQKPPREILELVDVTLPPQVVVDPEGRYLVTLSRPAFESLAELAEDELRLAGVRINPATFNRSRTRYHVGVGILEISTAKAIPVAGLPEPLRLEYAAFSPRGRYLSLVEVGDDGLSLWLVELATGAARKLTGPVLNAVLDQPYQWLPDESGLLCRFRSGGTAAPAVRTLPIGPTVQEGSGRAAPGRTWQDLLSNAADEPRFELYTTASVVRVALDGSAAEILPPAIYRDLRVVRRPLPARRATHAPFSYLFPLSRFPYRVFGRDVAGKTVAELADKPLQDAIPITFDAAEAGRRDFAWRNDAPATVVWVEALDGGDPAIDVPARDRVFQLDAPFDGALRPLLGDKPPLR